MQNVTWMINKFLLLDLNADILHEFHTGSALPVVANLAMAWRYMEMVWLRWSPTAALLWPGGSGEIQVCCVIICRPSLTPEGSWLESELMSN